MSGKNRPLEFVVGAGAETLFDSGLRFGAVVVEDHSVDDELLTLSSIDVVAVAAVSDGVGEDSAAK